MNLGKYAKFWTALVGLGLTAASAFYGPSNPWITAVIAVAGAAGVYAIPNAGYAEVKNEEHAGQAKTVNL